MTRVCEVRFTRRPIEEVFAYVADFSTTAVWDPGVAQARCTTDGPLGVGSTFAVDAVFLGRTLPMTYRIVELESPSRLVLEGQGATSKARDEILFDVVNGQTRVTWNLDLSLKGASRIASPFLGPFLRRLGRKALDGLHTKLQSAGPLRA